MIDQELIKFSIQKDQDTSLSRGLSFVALYEDNYQGYGRDLATIWPTMPFEEAAASFEAGSTCYVLYSRDQIVGGLWFYQNYFYDLVIFPKSRKGDSDALLAAVFGHYSHPSSINSVFTFVDSHDTYSIEFLEKLGGEIFQNYYVSEELY